MLRPTALQFPFDAICNQIAQALEARNWDIPGLTVKFHTYGSGASLYRILEEVKGEDFVLRFGRSQGRLGYYNDTAAIDRIAIPRKDLAVYTEECGPTFAEYIGDDWAADREQFLNCGTKFRDDESGRYIAFNAVCDCRSTRGASFPALDFLSGAPNLTHTHEGRRSPVLVATSDKERRYRTDDIYNEFAAWLEENVLRMIESFPLVQPDYSQFVVEKIDFPSNLPEIYCFAKFQDAVRIRQGQRDMSTIPAHERYALQQARRWVNLGSHDRLNPIPDTAYDGFIWCGFGSVNADSAVKDIPIPDHLPWDEEFVCRVKPNRANDIYVGDHSPYLKRRAEIGATLGDRDRFTDQELNEMYAARGHAFVPITDYDGSFEQPVLLIGRELEFDEIEIVSTPKEGWMKDNWEARA
jgi:hypothetical protein